MKKVDSFSYVDQSIVEMFSDQNHKEFIENYTFKIEPTPEMIKKVSCVKRLLPEADIEIYNKKYEEKMTDVSISKSLKIKIRNLQEFIRKIDKKLSFLGKQHVEMIDNLNQVQRLLTPKEKLIFNAWISNYNNSDVATKVRLSRTTVISTMRIIVEKSRACDPRVHSLIRELHNNQEILKTRERKHDR